MNVDVDLQYTVHITNLILPEVNNQEDKKWRASIVYHPTNPGLDCTKEPNQLKNKKILNIVI